MAKNVDGEANNGRKSWEKIKKTTGASGLSQHFLYRTRKRHALTKIRGGGVVVRVGVAVDHQTKFRPIKFNAIVSLKINTMNCGPGFSLIASKRMSEIRWLAMCKITQ